MADATTTIFTLGAALDKINAKVTDFERQRAIIIDSINAFQTAFADFVVGQENQDSHILETVTSAASRVDSLGSTLGDRIGRLESRIEALNTSLTDQMAVQAANVASLNADVTNLSSLVQAMLQALQGVATSARQDEELGLLTTITQDLEPTKATSIGLDLSHVTTDPQPRPSKPGP